MRNENGELARSNAELSADRKQLEAENESQRRHFTVLLEQRQRALDESAAKASPVSVSDVEALKSKLSRMIEAPYRQKLDAAEEAIEKKDMQVGAWFDDRCVDKRIDAPERDAQV